MPGPAGGTGWRRPARRTREAGLHRAFGSRERGKKSGSPSGQWVTAPGKGGGSVRSEIFGAQERESPCSRRPSPPPPPQAHTSNLLLVTPFTSLLMGPAGAAGAGRCGVRSAKTGGPGQAPEFRDGEEVEERRAGAVGGEGKPLGSGRASSTSRRAGGGDDCSSLALLSPQPQLQPKTKTLPTCQQRRSSLGRTARASERRGEGRRRSARRRRRGTTPPPLPGAARDGPPGSSRSAAAAAARARSCLRSTQAHREKERQGSAYLFVCICVWEGLWGGRECARARGLASEESRTTAHSTGAHLIPFAGRQHAPTQQALELSVKSSQPP